MYYVWQDEERKEKNIIKEDEATKINK